MTSVSGPPIPREEMYGVGLSQDEFLEFGRHVIAQGVSLAREQKEAGTFSLEPFLEFFGGKRQVLATTQRSKEAELFGRRRDIKLDIAVSPLEGGVYHQYSMAHAAKILKDIKESPQIVYTSFAHGEVKKQRESHLGRIAEVEVELIPFDKVDRWGFTTEAEQKRVCKREKIKVDDLTNRRLTEDKSRKIKAKNPDFIRRCLLGTAIQRTMSSDLSGIPVFTVSCHKRLEMDGKLVSLGRVIQLIVQETMRSSVDLRERKTTVPVSPALILHQDALLFQYSMKQVQQYFVQAMAWSSTQAQEELTNNVGMIVYMLAHMMPFYRGTASITEWLEQTIYTFHGLELKPRDERHLDLDALTAWFPEEFMEIYNCQTNFR